MKKNKKGFTLIEIVMAMALTIILMTIFTSALLTGSNSLFRIKENAQAATLCDTLITKICSVVGFATDVKADEHDDDILLFTNAVYGSNAEIYSGDDGYIYIQKSGDPDPELLIGEASYIGFSAYLSNIKIQAGTVSATLSIKRRNRERDREVYKLSFNYNPQVG